MAISKVWIDEGCIACGLCSDLCPEVFSLEDVAIVKADADLSRESCIKESAESCPTEVIKYE